MFIFTLLLYTPIHSYSITHSNTDTNLFIHNFYMLVELVGVRIESVIVCAHTELMIVRWVYFI